MIPVNVRANEVRDRIAKRKNKQLRNIQSENVQVIKPKYQYGDVEYTKSEYPKENEVGSSTFLGRLLISILLVSVIAIIFQLNQKPFTIVQDKIGNVMEQEFKFATVSNWYETTFGEPLTFFTNKNNELVDNTEVIQTTGKVLENFETNGQGILIENDTTKVVSLEEGLVIYTGEKDGIGKTVIVQNIDGTETWYGKLDTISVSVYDEVKKGDVLAQSIPENNGDVGTYYLAMKKENEFIDPNQVILFE